VGRTILITGSKLGHGDEALGEVLMGSFLRKLCIAAEKPSHIILYNSAVHLIAQGSPVLDAFETLAIQGVDILACGTCLGHFNLLDKVAAGRKSDMQEIVSILTSTQVTTV
jgi:intracellular sulfur oxidation DsrE/DsrF family protein